MELHNFQEEAMANQNEVYEKIKSCLVDALGVDEEEIKP